VIPGYQAFDNLWSDTLGDALEARHNRAIRDIEIREYNRILAEKGKAAAIEYQRTPKAACPMGAVRAYDEWHWLLVLLTLGAVFLALYHLLWRIGEAAVRYVVHEKN
jgi:hypothetical protein